MKNWMLTVLLVVAVLVLVNDRLDTPVVNDSLSEGRVITVDAAPMGFDPPIIAGAILPADPLPAVSDDGEVEGNTSSPPVHQRQLAPGKLVSQPSADSAVSDLITRLSVVGNPMPGSVLTAVPGQLPGAPRTYRNGIHQGLDFYGGACGRTVTYGDEVAAAGDGVVIRADVHYEEPEETERTDMLATAVAADDTPPDILDKLHGAQVWIDHGAGVITRYSHLSAVSVQVGQVVLSGEVVGRVGNSGTGAGARGSRDDAHLHFEIHVDGRPFWDGLSLQQMQNILIDILSR